MSEIREEAESFRDILYTADRYGRRKWVYPAVAKGRFLRRRTVVAYLLLTIYLSGPWLTIGGRQAFLFDLVNRKFTIAGIEFWATDTLYLMLVLATLAISLFFFTSLLGRVWCGWACPQTVYLEFLFRPIERLIEGGPVQRHRLDAQPWNFEKIWKKGLKLLIFVFLSWLIANTFLAYLYGAGPVLEMMRHSPSQNPGAFGLSLFIMLVFLFEFGWFREQFCTILCPYARFQSVMLDRNSLVIGYDAKRGEPRGKKRAKAADGESKGDCIDCGACVRVCPTGIDIRNGLQLECVNCAGCVDACDDIMDSVGKPRGLIRYASENALLGASTRILRPRIVVYSVVISVLIGALVISLYRRAPFDADIVRRPALSPFAELPGNLLTNTFFVELANKSSAELLFNANAPAAEGEGVVVSLLGAPIPVAPGEMQTVPLLFTFPRSLLTNGKKQLEVQVFSAVGTKKIAITLVGPD